MEVLEELLILQWTPRRSLTPWLKATLLTSQSSLFLLQETAGRITFCLRMAKPNKTLIEIMIPISYTNNNCNGKPKIHWTMEKKLRSIQMGYTILIRITTFNQEWWTRTKFCIRQAPILRPKWQLKYYSNSKEPNRSVAEVKKDWN